MENAAKALMISAGVLIAILLLTLFTYLFERTADSSKNIYKMIEESKISKYNQQFLNYNDRENLTAEDVVSIVNLAEKSNEENKFAQSITIIGIDGTYFNSGKFLSEKYLKDKLGITTFKCSVTISTDTKVVSRINISQ